jgi:ubiquinone/menaquinone biosynthesis C-methylase UbiE
MAGTKWEESEFRRLFTQRTDSYARFIRSVGYPLAIRAYFGQCPFLRTGLRILDAGCGTGVVSLAVRDALLARGFTVGGIDGFDLTPAMLDRFRRSLEKRGIGEVRLAEANVLELGELPATWDHYDLVVSASMLEYVPRDSLPTALGGLRMLLRESAAMVLFITKQNWLMKPLIGRWWRSNLYTRSELQAAFEHAGFSRISFPHFPLLYRTFDIWGHIVEAQQPSFARDVPRVSPADPLFPSLRATLPR